MLAALLALIFAGSAAAQDAPVTPTIAVVEFPKALRFLGLPRDCYSPEVRTPDWVPDPDGEICSAALYEGQPRVVRHLAGPQLPKGVRIRVIAHQLDGVTGLRLLIVAAPFEDEGASGYFADEAYLPNPGRDFCFDKYDFDGMEDGPFRRIVAAGYKRRYDVGVLTKVEHYCVRG